MAAPECAWRSTVSVSHGRWFCCCRSGRVPGGGTSKTEASGDIAAAVSGHGITEAQSDDRMVMGAGCRWGFAHRLRRMWREHVGGNAVPLLRSVKVSRGAAGVSP
jgi:hypothetical protein